MEVEAKYSLTDVKTFEQLLGQRALGAYALAEPAVREISDTYLDTPSRDVQRAGYALRLRREAPSGRWRGALKGLAGADGALHQREEFELDIPPGALPNDWPPGPARDLARMLIGRQPLRETAVITQRRHQRLARLAGREAAELSLDEVVLAAGGGEKLSYEVEIELRPAGNLDDLRALADAVAAAVPADTIAPQPLSKLEQALALAAAARPRVADVRGDEAMAEAGRKIMRLHFERMLAQEPGVRAGIDPEAVHDMRVATRRQRAALRLFRAYFQPEALRAYRRALRQTAQALGEVRDWDVQLQAAQAYQSSLPAAEAAALQPLLDDWVRLHAQARTTLLAHLDSRAYRKFIRKVAAFLSNPGAGTLPLADGPPAPRLVRDLLPASVWEHYAALRAYEPVVPGAPLAVLHALRIETKRLRYVLEFFRPLLEPEAGPAIAALVGLQDHLGLLQDACVTRQRLANYRGSLGRHYMRQPVRQAVAAYSAAQSRVLELQQQTVSKPWLPVISQRFRRRLGKVVASL
jgi:triphosphatase